MGTSPSTISIIAEFTANGGEPAVGLTPSEILFKLVRIAKNGTDEETVWVAESATDEIPGTGTYFTLYDEALLDEYIYFSTALYGGLEQLDKDHYSRRYYG